MKRQRLVQLTASLLLGALSFCLVVSVAQLATSKLKQTSTIQHSCCVPAPVTENACHNTAAKGSPSTGFCTLDQLSFSQEPHNPINYTPIPIIVGILIPTAKIAIQPIRYIHNITESPPAFGPPFYQTQYPIHAPPLT